MQPTDPGKFTDKAWEAIVKSQDVARKYRNQQLEVENLAISLLEEDETATLLLERVSADPATLLKRLIDFVRRQPSVTTDGTNIYLGRGLDQLLDRVDAEREEKGDRFISVDHFWLAFAEDKRVGKNLLRSVGLDGGLLEEAIQKTRGTQKVVDQDSESRYNALEKYGRDLTAQAKEGKLDPVIGRDEEVRRVIQVLSRRTKNNPVLIGEPGVGKMAIAEGLAQRIVKGDVPESLKDPDCSGCQRSSYPFLIHNS